LNRNVPVRDNCRMKDAFAAFLHALPLLLGAVLVVGAVIGFWRGLSLRPRDPSDRVPDPKSPMQVVSDSYASPPRWPGWLRRLFGARN
jgi:hypothetical protein